MRFAAAALVFIFALTGCGSGGGGSSLLGGGNSSSGGNAPGSGSPASGSRTIAFTLTIPSSSASPSGTMRSVASVRHPSTISSQTQSITISVNGGPPQVFSISTCSGNPLTCTLSVGAPYGLDSFLILTYSGPNATGTVLNAAAVTISVSASGPNAATTTAGNVITVNDSADGSGGTYSCAGGSTTCTLREAVAEASTTAGVVTAIMFASSVTSITLAQANGQIQIAANQTIQILGPGASAANAAGVGAPAASGNVTISGGGNTGIFYVNVNAGLTVDGVTLSGGNNGIDSDGGAIASFGNLAIVNTTFSGNGGSNTNYGGAVYDQNENATPVITSVVNSTFTNNRSYDYGGAYYLENNDESGAAGGASFERCLFTNNVAFNNSDYGVGGGIYADWNVSVDSSTFTGNVAGSTSVSGAEGYGGAISFERNGVSPSITNNTFGGTTASAGNMTGGPSGDGYGGAIYDDGNFPLTLSGNTFSNNLAKGYDAYGGAIYDYDGIASTGDTFTNNLADASEVTSGGYSGGGAVYSDTITSWTNDTFTGNQSLGGKASAGATSGEAYGGAIYADYSDPVITQPFFTATQTTFSNNSGNAARYCYGGALYTYYDSSNGSQYILSNVQFNNNSCTATNTTNYAYAYGGAYFADYAQLSLSSVSFTGNTATASTTGGAPYYPYALGGGLEYYDGYYGCMEDCASARRPAPDSAARSLAGITATRARMAQQRATAQTYRTAHANRRAKLALQSVIHSHAPLSIRRTQSGGPTDGLANVTFTNNTVSATGYEASSYGGGADISGQLAVTTTTFTGNSALASGSNGPYAGGGGLSNGGDYCGQGASFSGTASGNLALDAGGGIVNYCSVFTVTNATISTNRVTNAQYAGDGGGGIWTGYGDASILQSTITGNVVAASTPIAKTGGGGIFNYDNTCCGGGVVTILNSTIFANQSAVDGGGIENDYYATLSLINATVYQNTALGKGGSIDNENKSGNDVITLVNTILAGGSAPTGPEVANLDTFVSWGGNLIQGAVSGNAIPAASQGIADLLGV
ncbi:MAG: hypothetical protein JO349_01565, partial [Candidatus Eremiobacteraeota bacterium]|nr:hypothetical protein [Candidatus Eremiobacteraeota bacterium]